MTLASILLNALYAGLWACTCVAFALALEDWLRARKGTRR